ncbi:MAG: cysteine desulfurase [Bacilli bacterium]|nr:cysteine desulfurase [Bacilli bacterium]
MNRQDFEMLKENIIYFDNGATTLKPSIIMNDINDYYNKYTANSHRGSYNNSIIVDSKYEYTRCMVKELINADKEKEIIFTSGATDSLNKIIFGFFKYYLKKGDEVLLTKSEHASNILPWFELEKVIGIKIKYIDLDNNHYVQIDNVKKIITSKTKVISLAHITNVIGDIRPIKEITALAHQNDILVVADGAQSVPHMKVDVKDLDVDFLAFSAHKMCGPTGVGIIYGKYHLLEKMKPIIFGGGMNESFTYDGEATYQKVPYCFEAGTPNIAGVIAFSKVIEYLLAIGLDNIQKHEKELRDYLVNELKKNDDIIIYNENSDSGIITINHQKLEAASLADYLNNYDICVRTGSHCAKILNSEIGTDNTCRISLYFYNNKEEIDYFINIINRLV